MKFAVLKRKILAHKHNAVPVQSAVKTMDASNASARLVSLAIRLLVAVTSTNVPRILAERMRYV